MIWIVSGIALVVAIGAMVLAVKLPPHWKLAPGLFITGVFIGILALVLGTAFGLSEVSCDRIGAKVERHVEFDVFAGCFVEVGGVMVPADERSLPMLLGVES